jgi:hypothetical protein
MAIPSIAMIPSGYKANKVYSVLPTDGSGDLDFARTTKATRVNQNGLIENVGNNVPCLDYKDGSCPSLLLEPTSRNLITHSEAFANSYWTKSGVSIEGDASTAGVEQVTNGDFATDTNWGKGTGMTISGGALRALNCVENTSLNQTGLSLDVNKTYIVTFTISNYVSGGIIVRFPFSNTNIISGNGTFTVTGTPDQSQSSLLFQSKGSNSTFDIDNVILKEVQGFSAPSVDSPLGAFKLVEDTSTGEHKTRTLGAVTVLSGYRTISYYVKYIDAQWVYVFDDWNGNGGYFDILNGVVGSHNSDSTNIESLGVDWYRVSITKTNTQTTSYPSLSLANGNNSNSYTGDGTSGVYIFGAQLEAQSYATSYIPTAGTTISRTADSASKSGISSLINSTEGVLYAEMSALYDDGTARSISLNSGSSSNRVTIQFRALTGQIITAIVSGGVAQTIMPFTISQTADFIKIALVYKVNDFSLYVNGVEVGTDSSGITFPTGVLNSVNFDNGSGSEDFYGKVKDLRVYNTALTDQELAALTQV